jgi:general secretion pathway protein D
VEETATKPEVGPVTMDTKTPEGGPDFVEELVLSNADPVDVVGILEKMTGRMALIEQKLPKTKIFIDIPYKITRSEAISAVESVLSLNGIAVVDMGEKFMKIVTSKSAITQSPGIIEESLLQYEPSQRVVSKFFKLQYLDAGEFQKSIKSILTPSTSNTILFAASNSLFITDTMANLQNVENLIQRTDTPIKMIEEINFIPLNHVKASAIAKKFEQLKRGTLKKYLAATTIDSDDSSNQLIVITPKENFSVIDDIVKHLDNKCETLLKHEVIRIKHADAVKIAKVVSEIVKEQRRRIEKENKMAFERQQAQLTAQGNIAKSLGKAASGSRSNQQISNSFSDYISTQQIPGELGDEQTTQFSANLALTSEPRSNSIIIYGTASDVSQVKSLIANLDVLLDQVRIEVIIAEVTLTKGQQSGMDAFGLDYNQKDNGNAFAGTARAHDIGGTIGFAGSSFTGTLRNFAFSSVLKQAKTDSNVKILSTPTLVTTHNRKAQFKMGEERPFMDSSTKSDDANAKERINIIYKHVGLDLAITPLIGSNGIVQMDIQQHIKKANAPVKIAGTEVNLVDDKEINSFVSVADGDVIVLAGFKEKTTTEGGGKMFLLGDIPVLGDLFFSQKKRDDIVRELIVFIRPTIILHPQDEAAYLDKKLEVTNFKKDIEHYRATGDFPEGEPFPEDTLFGLNRQELMKKHQKEKQRKLLQEEERKLLLEERKTSSLEGERHPIAEQTTDKTSAPTTDNEAGIVKQKKKKRAKKSKKERRKVAKETLPEQEEPSSADAFQENIWERTDGQGITHDTSDGIEEATESSRRPRKRFWYHR